MEHEVPARARITFDMKQMRIRIHKETFRLLGNPMYIQLLVHPDDGALAIRCVEKNEKPNFRVYWKCATGKVRKSYELKAFYFMRKLVEQLGLDWTDSYSYRMEGDIYPDKGLAVFRPSSAEQVITEGEYDGE